MRLLLFTNERFPSRFEFETRTLKSKNLSAAAAASPYGLQAEELLDLVRVMEYPSRPERAASVVLLPWPEHEPVERRVVRKREPKRLPDPPYLTDYCYYVKLLPGANSFLCDEGFAEKLAKDWRRMDDDGRYETARAYWDSLFMSEYTLLVEGPVRIEEPCRAFSA